LALSVLAVLVGVGPGQFVALVALGQLSENFQHANLRIWFGRVGERLWVSPRFHRRHHSIGIGHETERQGQSRLGGCNYGVLLPCWDMLFGTADFTPRFDPTGIRDQVEKGRDYGQGFWAQQWLGVLRLLSRA
jgi:sterol desaturase/sphingolipid hydroxylase (fatty acid hydroxylase superfamily)